MNRRRARDLMLALGILAAGSAGLLGGEESAARPPQEEAAIRPIGEPTARTRRFERRVAGAAKTVAVTITASAEIDERILDYLEATLRVVELADPLREELWALRTVDESKSSGDEISIALAALGRVDAGLFAWLPPDGFDVVRPGVLRPGTALAAGLAEFPDASLTPSPTVDAPPRVSVTGPFTLLRGTLLCEAFDGSATIRNPLGFLELEIDGHVTTTATDGAFELAGGFGPGTYKVKAIFDSTVGSGPPVSRLQVMDDLHRTRSETTSVRSQSTSGDAVELGEVVLTSVDCELWRLGTLVLEDYHRSVGASPPAGELRLKRWSGIWHGDPHAYYDYVVLTTNFTRAGSSRSEGRRRAVMFHEFGHSIRHVADGDEFHWAWDNFRWAYARSHTGCEVFNTQYAFNEGWANYWRFATLGPALCSPALGNEFRDWNEDRIGVYLTTLAEALCPAGSPPACAKRRMVNVLETFPGEIHSLRDFEVRYCELFAGGNANCDAPGVPARAQPPSCPPGFHDDGATCRLVNILAKPSYGRGVGTIPNGCGPGQERDAGLCYPLCSAGFSGVGPVCWEACPAGFRDDGAFCAKPAPYGRGAGYPWRFGDAPFDLGGARRRCESDHGSGNCEQNGLIFYPRCRAGFHNVGCCICSPDCPPGMTDIGVSCTKRSHGRGVGTIPSRCPAGRENDAGLCYPPCQTGFAGVGPVCWGPCPPGFADHGATCYRPPNILVKY